MDLPELKPCPFCGGDADYNWRDGYHGAFGYIRCDTCDATSGTAKLTYRPNECADELAFWTQHAFMRVVKKWNRRTNEE